MKIAFLCRVQSWIYMPLLMLAYVLAFTNGFRMPSLWSINYFIPSVFEGFYRRSLLGTLLFPLGDWRFHYYTIASIQIALFFLLNMVILYQVMRSNMQGRWLWVLFLLSPAGGYFFHEIGYVDQVLYLLLIWALGMRSTWHARILLLLSLFIHELALFTILPIYLAYSFYEKREEKDLLITAGLSFLVFSVIYCFLQTSNPISIAHFLEGAQQIANYPIRLDYYNVFKKSFIGGILQVPYLSREIINHLLLIPIWCMAAWSFSISGADIRERCKLFAAGFMASAFPILLGIFGWDYSRWIFLSMASTWICIFIARNQINWRVLVLIGVYSLCLPTVGFLDYFDNYTPRFAPWYQWQYFYQVDLWKLIGAIPGR